MSVNIKTKDGLKEILGKVTEEQVVKALGYFPADEEVVKNIDDDESGDFVLADDNGNIVCRVDKDGLHVTAITLGGVVLKFENWTFTLADGTTVTKKVCVG